MVTSLVWRLSPVISFHPEMGLVVLVASVHEYGVLLEAVALRGGMVAAIAAKAVCAAVYEGAV